MNILIIGGGGREHALAWKVAQSPLADKVYVAPGNAGTEGPKVENLNIDVTEIKQLRNFAIDNAIDLTIVGPEVPLTMGIVDVFENHNLKCFGPRKAAAQLEGSKSFMKDFLKKHGIPTAKYATFTDESWLGEIVKHVSELTYPIVIKADGLAAGKGVMIANDYAEAFNAIAGMLSGDFFGDAGKKIVIEEFLEGEEVSFIVMTDGKNILPMSSSQDHKARDNGDAGPNTGGMGAYSPSPLVDKRLHDRIMDTIIKPTIEGLAQDGLPYVGFLYAGLMIDKNGNPKVLEYNCRLGDPETQPLMMRLESDIVSHFLAAVYGTLDEEYAVWSEQAALGVVMASGGYPGDYKTGLPITGGYASYGDVTVFHAGTKRDGVILTDGGRVLCVTALGDTVSEARDKAYAKVDTIHWPGVYYRTDIGHRAIKREQEK